METIEFIKIQDMINDLYKKIDDLNKNRIIVPESNSSESTENLMAALAKAQGEYTIADLNKKNSYVKNPYADYMSIVNASRPALVKYGISVIQPIKNEEDGALWLYTIISLGNEWKQSKMRILAAKNDIQYLWSYITFLKRECYKTFLGVVVKDDDDDGEEVMATSRELYAKGTALNHDYDPKQERVDVITREQLDELNYELKDYPDIAKDLLDYLKIRSMADVPKEQYRFVSGRARELKGLRNGK